MTVVTASPQSTLGSLRRRLAAFTLALGFSSLLQLGCGDATSRSASGASNQGGSTEGSGGGQSTGGSSPGGGGHSTGGSNPGSGGQDASGAIGLMYMFPSYKADPPPDPASSSGLTNPHLQGMLWRESWDKLDLGQGQHDWSFLDAAFNASDSNGKLSSLQVLAGSYSPSWFFDLPGAARLDLTGTDPTTVPWDPVFQKAWEEVIAAMAARYDGRENLEYVVMAGVGNASESYLVRIPQDQPAADELAQSMGYPDAVTAWKAGVTWLIDMYARHWHKTPFVLVTGPPFPDGGEDALQAMYDYGDSTYPGRFGARADDLTANSPKPSELSATVIPQISPHCRATGYQFANHQNINDPSPPMRLDQALQHGIGFGAHFIEVFADDADDPVSAPALDAAAAQLLSH